MPIKTSSVPQEVFDVLKNGLAQLKPPSTALTFVARFSSGSGIPHQLWHLGLDAIKNGHGIGAADLTGWRFLLDHATAHPTVAADVQGKSVPHKFGGLHYGPFVAATFSALKTADSEPRLRGEALEPRLLQIPALFVVALWLKAQDPDKDVFVPLAPAPPSLTVGRHYTKDDLEAELVKLSQSIGAPPPNPHRDPHAP